DTITATALRLGPGTATSVVLSKVGGLVQVSSDLQITSQLDTVSNGAVLNVGTVRAGQVHVGSGTAAVTVQSQLTVQGLTLTQSVLTRNLDTYSNQVLTIAALNASRLDLGNGAIPVRAKGSLQVSGSVDTFSSTPLQLCPGTCSAVVLGSTTTPVQAQGPLTVQSTLSITDQTIDTVSVPLYVAPTTTSRLVLGHASIPTEIQSSNISVNSSIDTFGNTSLHLA